MASSFGKKLQVTIFGQSHGTSVGGVVDGLPAGFEVDIEELQTFLDRRRPGKSALSTPRSETDIPHFLSGLEHDTTVGAPLAFYIANKDTRSEDYDDFEYVPRPSHADYTAYLKWDGKADMRGGGHFSGRLTAPLCVAGGIAKQILKQKGITIGAHLLQVHDIHDERFPLQPSAELLEEMGEKTFPVLNDEAGQEMQQRILDAGTGFDSVGGIIECAAIGVPAGLGSPMFEGMENRLAQTIFGIPAVRGVSFGTGFDAVGMKGSEHNDPFVVDEDGTISAATNNAGGILGGITSGMPLVLQVAIKPTASIGLPQQSVDMYTKEPTTIEVLGRHDPCIAHRAVPVVEAAVACVVLDALLEEGLVK